MFAELDTYSAQIQPKISQRQLRIYQVFTVVDGLDRDLADESNIQQFTASSDVCTGKAVHQYSSTGHLLEPFRTGLPFRGLITWNQRKFKNYLQSEYIYKLLGIRVNLQISRNQFIYKLLGI